MALDGAKARAGASKEANRTEEGLRKLAGELAAAHAAADAEEDALSGKGRRGDDDPGDPFTRSGRVAAALASLEAEREAREAAERDRAEAALAAARVGAPAPGSRPAAADVALAELKVARETAAYQARARERGEAVAAMAAAGGPGDGKTGLVLAGAGYLSEHNLTCPGPDRLIATGKQRDPGKAARAAGGKDPGQGEEPPIAAMASRLAAEEGTAAYRRRSHTGETFHGDLKHNQHIRRLPVRGLRKASGEWTFITAVRNLRKAITSGHLTAGSLTALAR